MVEHGKAASFYLALELSKLMEHIYQSKQETGTKK